VSVLHIPQNYKLKVPPATAVDLLAHRIARGEELLSGRALDVDEFRRAVVRWQAENDAIVESLLDTGEPTRSAAAAAPSRGTENEFEALKGRCECRCERAQ
jgi:hypothetical protein